MDRMLEKSSFELNFRRSHSNMKVLLAVVLALGSASAIGSGPYLPSGWRPQGPAFYLPSEARLPAANPLADVVFQGSEASGSDFLREYGPPKLQDLPKEVREQAFVVEAKFGDEEVVVEAATEAITELRSALVEDSLPSTESQTESVEVSTPAEVIVRGKSLNLEVDPVAEEIEASTQGDVATEATVFVQVNARIQAEEEIVEEGVKDIAEAIVSFEKEAVEQAQISQDITESKPVELKSGTLAAVPEGFLEYGPPGFQEYGPPGFKEYGPPKEGAILRNDDLNTRTEEELVENNETRRRRFSPKFRSTKKH